MSDEGEPEASFDDGPRNNFGSLAEQKDEIQHETSNWVLAFDKNTCLYVFSCALILQKNSANIVCLDASWFDISSETAFQKVPQI